MGKDDFTSRREVTKLWTGIEVANVSFQRPWADLRDENGLGEEPLVLREGGRLLPLPPEVAQPAPVQLSYGRQHGHRVLLVCSAKFTMA